MSPLESKVGNDVNSYTFLCAPGPSVGTPEPAPPPPTPIPRAVSENSKDEKEVFVSSTGSTYSTLLC